MQLNTLVPVCGKEKTWLFKCSPRDETQRKQNLLRPHLEPRQVLLPVSLTSVVFTSPVSASHKRTVWSQDALQTSSLSLQRTEDTASLCPDRVMRGVWMDQGQRRTTRSLLFSLSYGQLCHWSQLRFQQVIRNTHPGKAKLLSLLFLPWSVRRFFYFIGLICGHWQRK